MFPISSRLANLGIGDADKSYFKKLEEGFDWWIKKNDAKVIWKRVWHENTELNPKIFYNVGKKLVISIGDRAGLVNPLTAEGIYYAMKSGRVLANAICKDNLSIYKFFINRTKYKFMLYKKIRDVGLLPDPKPRLAFLSLEILRAAIVK